jgi:hypothetical protein
MTTEDDDFVKHSNMYEEGIKHYEEQNYAESILSFRKATEYLPFMWFSWVRLSLACVRQAMIDKSDSLFSEAFVSAQR